MFEKAIKTAINIVIVVLHVFPKQLKYCNSNVSYLT